MSLQLGVFGGRLLVLLVFWASLLVLLLRGALDGDVQLLCQGSDERVLLRQPCVLLRQPGVLLRHLGEGKLELCSERSDWVLTSPDCGGRLDFGRSRSFASVGRHLGAVGRDLNTDPPADHGPHPRYADAQRLPEATGEGVLGNHTDERQADAQHDHVRDPVVCAAEHVRIAEQQHHDGEEDEPVLERHERAEPLVPERPDLHVHDHCEDCRGQTHEEERRLVREHHREAR
mmetsp:Transcript_99264/g.283984  ORF Transcript_99264/g.283984 Transcript_99264/m.283984 type:complete len:231 (-) Transcript_99264:1087-1779(-)